MVVENVLAGIIVALISFAIGKVVGERGAIKNGVCEERRAACMALVTKELKHLKEAIEGLKEDIGKLQKAYEGGLR